MLIVVKIIENAEENVWKIFLIVQNETISKMKTLKKFLTEEFSLLFLLKFGKPWKRLEDFELAFIKIHSLEQYKKLAFFFNIECLLLYGIIFVLKKKLSLNMRQKIKQIKLKLKVKGIKVRQKHSKIFVKKRKIFMSIYQVKKNSSYKGLVLDLLLCGVLRTSLVS